MYSIHTRNYYSNEIFRTNIVAYTILCMWLVRHHVLKFFQVIIYSLSQLNDHPLIFPDLIVAFRI